MRRQEREVSDPEHLAGILGRAVTAHVAFLDRGEPAVVPLSFGFEVRDGVFHFYFHGAAEGRKAECWRADPRVSASFVGTAEFVPGSPRCRSTCLYESVIASGNMECLTDLEEKIHALNRIMAHYGGESSGAFPAAALERTAVFHFAAASISGKSNRP